MRGVGNQHRLFFAALLGEFHRIRIGQRVHRQLLAALAAHVHRLDERAHANAQGALCIALIHLQNQRRFARNLPHQADDLIREIGIVPTAKAHQLYIFQVFALCCQNGGGQHPRMIIVGNVQPAATQVHPVGTGQRVGGQHRHPHGSKQLRQVMVYKGVIVIRPAGQHHSIPPLGAHPIHHILPGFQQLRAEGILCLIRRLHGRAGLLRRNAELLAHIRRQLGIPVCVRIPVEQRGVKRHAPAALRIVRIAHHKGIPLYHGAHGIAGGRGIFAFQRGDGGHENAVHSLLDQIADVPMHQLCRKAHRIGGNGGKAGFIQGPVAQRRKLHLKAQAAPEGTPKGHGVPERKAAGQTDGHIPRRRGAGNRIFFKQQLLPQAE